MSFRAPVHTQQSFGSNSGSPVRLPFSSLVCQQNQREYRMTTQAPKEEESAEAEV